MIHQYLSSYDYKDSVFIFTDGAITEGISSGSAVYGIPVDDINKGLGLTKVRAWSKFHNSSTNNEAELTGIFVGIQHASKEYPGKTLYVFSDSEYCVKSLTEWIFTWYKTYTLNKRNGIIIPSMMSKGGTPVKNAQLICLIINYIVTNDLYVQFINVKGHTKNNVEEQIKYFEKANKCILTTEEAKFITKYNHIVDRVAVIVSNFIKNSGFEGTDLRKSYMEFSHKGMMFRVEDCRDEDELFGQYYLLNHNIMNSYKYNLNLGNKPF